MRESGEPIQIKPESEDSGLVINGSQQRTLHTVMAE